MKQVDVAIIGGSLAGAACVRELNRLGVDAAAFERERFPREKVCGGFLSPGAVSLIDELGLLDAVRRAGAVEVRSARVRLRDREWHLELPRPGLGISRRALDCILADHPGVLQGSVRDVAREGNGFRVRLDEGDVLARVVVDAAGKLSRFTQRAATEQFGVQFYEAETRGDVLDFWFFANGYGGAVTVEGARSSACFLIDRAALPRYRNRPGCRVTGPVAYRECESDYIAIGDAAGMIDPFCGEGMRHALDTGMLAARVVATGLRRGASAEEMKRHYEGQRARRWAGKRRLAGIARRALRYPEICAAAFGVAAPRFVRHFWDVRIAPPGQEGWLRH